MSERHLKAEKLQWDLGSKGRCLDLRPHGQAPAATVRGGGVLEGDSHSGHRQPSGGPDAGCSPYLAHVRASSLAAAVTGQGALLRVSSKIPGQGLNLQGQGRRAAPCLCVQAAVRKTEPSRRYACAHTHTLSKSHTRADTHRHASTCVHTIQHTEQPMHTCAHLHVHAHGEHTHARNNLEQARFSASH